MDRNSAVFTPYPFTIGEKIKITGGKRAGDWEVVGLTDSKVKLRCPVSGREFEWARFCYQLTDLSIGQAG
ncbi:MAG: hypothetical protein GXP59_00520 [Deltaproteobacteria bacterium]|nr:hypothetical protein [Deltaproteobacteria bacterium]